MKKPKKDLIIALKSEVLGEAFFRSTYYSTYIFDRKNKARVLWQLEAQTKKRIIEYFKINSIEIPNLRWVAVKGSILGILCLIVPRYIILQEILKETEYYLTVFRRLERENNVEDKELFQYIVDHEIAIKQFAKMELKNRDRTNSLELIEALLNN